MGSRVGNSHRWAELDTLNQLRSQRLFKDGRDAVAEVQLVGAQCLELPTTKVLGSGFMATEKDSQRP